MKKITRKKLFFVMVAVIMMLTHGISTHAAVGSKVYLFGLHDSDGADRYSWMDNIANIYKMRDSRATVKKYNYFSHVNIKTGLQKANYLTIHTHGSRTGIVAVNKKGKKTRLKVSAIKKWEGSLSQLNVCYIAACNAAPVAKAIYNKGARTTIGYTVTVNTERNMFMHRCFNAYFTIGQSVSKSMTSAKNRVLAEYGTCKDVKNYVIYGDKKQKF